MELGRYVEKPLGDDCVRPLRIVLVMIEAPVPFGNAASRWYYVLLRELVSRGHHVTVFAACTKAAEIEEARRLFPAPEYDLRLYPIEPRAGLRAKLNSWRRPFSYMFSDDFHRDLQATLASGFDVCHLEHLWSGWLAQKYTDRSLLKIHYLFSIDLSTEPPRGLRERVIRRMMLRGERKLLRAYPHIASISDRLVDRIQEIAPRSTVEFAPCGIDASLYEYLPDEKRNTQPIVGLIGQMGWYPSRSAAERLLSRLWPEIKRQVPEATCQIVGWGARSVLSAYLNLPDVTLLENVPDVRPYFENLNVLLYAPGRGSGVKVKIQEAFAYGIPVVTTSEGVEGMPALDGVHAGVCDDDAGLIERTVALLKDSATQNRQRTAARAMLESYCSPQATVDAVEAIYFRMLPTKES